MMDTSHGVLLLWNVEILTPRGWESIAENVYYADAIRRFGTGTDIRLTRATS